MKLKVTLVKSTIGRLKKHIATVQALGLRKVGHSVIREDSPGLRGQLFAVKHLISVEEVNED